MSMVAVLAALAVGGATAPRLEVPDTIQSRGADLRLEDALDLSALPASLRAAAAKVVIATSAKKRSITLDRRDFTARLRRRVPALGPWLHDDATGAVTIRFPEPPLAEAHAPTNRCVALTRAIPANDFVLKADLQPQACDGGPRENAFYFDSSSGFSRAREDLEAGLIALAPPDGALTALPPGKTVVLSVKVGPVSVERVVSTVQPARNGAPMFVSDDSGAVFRAPAIEVAP